MKKKIKPAVWIVAAVAAVGIVGGALTGGSNETEEKKAVSPPATPTTVTTSTTPEVVLTENPSTSPAVIEIYVASEKATNAIKRSAALCITSYKKTLFIFTLRTRRWIPGIRLAGFVSRGNK